MLLVRPLQSIATTISFLSLAGAANGQTISGDCNVVAPQGDVSGNITYEINCNNITSNASVQIQRILNLIETGSESAGSSDEFERTLLELATVSQSGLEEFRRSRAPNITISQDRFEVCDRCYGELEFVNQGGRIARVDEFTYIELVAAGVDIYDDTCPFRVGGAFQSNWITMDYGEPGFHYITKEYFDEGDTIGRIQLAQAYRNKLEFERQTLEQYNIRMRYEYAQELDMATLERCVDFEYSLGVKISAITYQGSLYEQYYLFDYELDGNGTHVQLSERLFESGRQGYNAFFAKYIQLKESRRFPDTGSQSPTYSVLAEFILGNYALIP